MAAPALQRPYRTPGVYIWSPEDAEWQSWAPVEALSIHYPRHRLDAEAADLIAAGHRWVAPFTPASTTTEDTPT